MFHLPLPYWQSSKFGLESTLLSCESEKADPNPGPVPGANRNPPKSTMMVLLLCGLRLSCGPLWPMSWERKSSGGLLGKVSSREKRHSWRHGFLPLYMVMSMCDVWKGRTHLQPWGEVAQGRGWYIQVGRLGSRSLMTIFEPVNLAILDVFFCRILTFQLSVGFVSVCSQKHFFF